VPEVLKDEVKDDVDVDEARTPRVVDNSTKPVD
jgi:hypothetical protein